MKPFTLVFASIAALASAASGCREGSGQPGGTGSSARPTATAEAPPRAASAAELALIAPAAPGAKLADYDVREVRAADRSPLEIVCEKATLRVILSVALRDEKGPAPPASTDRFAVFYSARGAPPEDGERLAKALASLLQTNKAVPVPPSIGVFVPRPLSL